ncbi:MAG: sulfur carrier protein ThiS [Campylobacterota bacterium]|nr:sulfur carrier protein ThiS [Campylobacterota bacterium]
MNIIVNGEEKSFEDNMNLRAIMQNLQIEDKVMAAAINMDVVKKENWDTFVPNEGDKLELLQFVGGG